MSGHKYSTSIVVNLLDEDEIDVETIPKNPIRRAISKISCPEGELGYAEQFRAIEERTLESSSRGLATLYETEEEGIATAEELARQHEQLDNTNRHLNDMNQPLCSTRKRLKRMRSLFCCLTCCNGEKDMKLPSQMSVNFNFTTSLIPNTNQIDQLDGQNIKSPAENRLHQSQTALGNGSNFNDA